MTVSLNNVKTCYDFIDTPDYKMLEKVTLEELQYLCDELDLYGIPLQIQDVSNPLDAETLLRRLVKSTWKLMRLQRDTVHAKSAQQDEIDRQKYENRQLHTEISLLKRRLAQSNEKEKRASDRADLATRELNSVSPKVDNNLARQKYEALAENEMYRRLILSKDAEIAELKNKLQSKLENGKISTRTRPKPIACSEREAALKQVVCKYQEANQQLVEENLSLIRLLENQGEDEDDED